jgi:hypothetical protein
MGMAGRFLGVVLLVVGAGGCSNELHGALEVTVRTSGGQHWSTMPSQCVSGQRQGFFGVDMRAGTDDGTLVRAIIDPKDGPILKVNVPGTDQALTLRPGPGCSQFDVHVERQSSSINDITNVRGHVRVTCDDPELALKADITFENCH